MNRKILVCAVISFLTMFPGFGQEKSRRELKEERFREKQKQTEEIINSKEFVFTGQLAIPTKMNSVDLTTHYNYVNFHPDLIESNMPFYGEAHTSVGYSGDTGLKFEGRPLSFTVTKGKRNYRIVVKVKGGTDYYDYSLDIGLEGSATLSVSSANRSFISYIGEISPMAKSKE